ncbi:MAG TPA: lipase maturation factor family protein [Candidatus Acidoferrales bacterium]|nr:lipase maturation factor family protein [Candidatus Acidoferrales bacterium]
MRGSVRVAHPPSRPLLVFDGDCHFCGLWVRRWRQIAGDAVDYLPAQDARIAEQFPEIPREQYATAVQLIAPDGVVFWGAEAVFRALAQNPRWRWPGDAYDEFPVFARFSEWAYRFVGGHRKAFSRLTRLCWGRHVERPSYDLVRWLFLRSLGLVYFFAFVSFWTQITGLIGHDGILPADQYVSALRQQCDQRGIGLERFYLVPTLCWLNSSDAFLNLQCAAGTALSLLLIMGLAPVPCLVLLWMLWLSLAVVGRDFMGFQWDNLLLETGFLAIFLAPLQWRPRRPGREAPPSRLFIWLLRLLLFKLMFSSGCVKLLSGDPNWRNLTALTYHYETQPLPPWTAWYANQLPLWFQKFSCAGTLVIEIGAPFLIFAPRRVRFVGAALLAWLQVLILITGNYCYFNWLTLALCLVLLDDFALEKIMPRRFRAVSPQNSENAGAPRERGLSQTAARVPAKALESSPPPSQAERCAPNLGLALEQPALRPRLRWRFPLLAVVAAVVVASSSFMLALTLGFRSRLLAPLAMVAGVIEPFRSVNNYGLFAVMTTRRNEIIVEGSNDGVNWLPYEFKYKPGNIDRRPAFVAPLQPRLDWQMWFAALGTYQDNPWFVNFCVRLLQGSPEVAGLLARNPFPNHPPRFIRAQLYEYHFSHPAERRATGAWWRRELVGEYMPAISLHDHKVA